MRQLKIGDWVNNSVPENFYECSFSQKVQAMTAKIYFELDNMPDGTVSKVKTELCLELGRIPKKLFKQLSAEQVIAIKRLWSWVGEIKITKQPFEFFEFQGVRYYLPSDNFANTSAIEWAMSMILYTQFGRSENPNGKAIYELVMTLCRPARADAEAHRKSTKWNGDVREEYNSFLAQERAEKIESGLEWGVILSVKEFYENMLTTFAKKYETLFEETDLKPLFYGGEGCIAMLEDVAESDVFGNLEKVYDANIDSIYMYLKHKKLKAERMEDEEEKRQRDLENGFR